MAIRERKGRASPWQVYWNNPFTGKRECASFKTKLEAQEHDSLIRHKLKFDRESFRPAAMEDENQNTTHELTLEEAFYLYLKEKGFDKMGLHWQMGAMRLPLQRYGNMPLAAIGKQELAALLKEMTSMNVKSTTVRGRLSVLRTLLRWCAAKDMCGTIAFPKLPAATYERFVPPTPEELAAMLSVAEPHIARVIIIGSQCGVRVGPCELFGLTWEDVDFERRILRVHGSKKNPAASWREVPLRDSLVEIMRRWHEADMETGLFRIIHYNGKPVESIKNAWRRTLKRAGITRRIRPYDLRHAFATELIANGADIGTVARLMGHTSPAMILAHYQYVMDTQKRAAIEALPDLPYVPKKMCPKNKGLTELQ